jgi:transketolase
MAAGLKCRPAVLSPFVTRPAVPVPDRRKLGMPPASAAARGVYAMRRANTPATLVIQGCGSANMFVHDVLPILDKEGVKLNVFYIASAELFELLPKAARDKIFPPKLFSTAMGITDFTLPTLRRWVRSEAGIEASLYPFRAGEFLGSGNWKKVLEEGGLSGPSQLKAVRAWVRKTGKK